MHNPKLIGNKLLIINLLVMLFLVPHTYTLGSSDSEVMPASDIDEVARALELSRFNAPIKSKDDLDIHLSLAQPGTSPFHALSVEALKRFIDSLVFTDYGLASWRYDDIVIELSDRQIYEIMKMFGQQYHSLLVDESLLSYEEQRIRKVLYDAFGTDASSQDSLDDIRAILLDTTDPCVEITCKACVIDCVGVAVPSVCDPPGCAGDALPPLPTPPDPSPPGPGPGCPPTCSPPPCFPNCDDEPIPVNPNEE